MYCVKCGVELREGIDNCPLCGTPVWKPEGVVLHAEPAPYPEDAVREPPKATHGHMFIITGLFAVALIICALTDVIINRAVTWSGYPAVGLGLLYVCFVLPSWFSKPNPVIFFPCAAAAVLLTALFVCLKTGGRWFLSFALPVFGAFALIVETVIVLSLYTVRKKRYRFLYIFGGALIAIGALCVLIELLLNVTFGLRMIWWSLIPLISLFLLGMFLIVAAISPHLRSSLYKRSFI
ncbi:MAG: hypothetical protein ILO53_02690 [Clostridia bacterium]|nr:hypothetical protein [Clostridia bacterium]